MRHSATLTLVILGKDGSELSRKRVGFNDSNLVEIERQFMLKAQELARDYGSGLYIERNPF